MFKNSLLPTIKNPLQKFLIKKQKERDNDFTTFWLPPYVDRMETETDRKYQKGKCKKKFANKELKKANS